MEVIQVIMAVSEDQPQWLLGKKSRNQHSFLEHVGADEQTKWLGRHTDSVYRLAQQDSELGRQVKSSLAILEEALDKYGPQGMSISFNGGKDCTVMLHLWAAVCFHRFHRVPSKLHTLYILDPRTFVEIDEFVADCIDRYNLDLTSVEGSVKEGLAQMLGIYSDIKAVLVGARRTDPYYGDMTPFRESDKGWAPCMRVHPVLDWSYHQVWEFLRVLDVPYCSLYDRGYTSIGHVLNTLPNPLLKNDMAPHGYDPAYLLQHPDTERAGRVKSTPTTAA